MFDLFSVFRLDIYDVVDLLGISFGNIYWAF